MMRASELIDEAVFLLSHNSCDYFDIEVENLFDLLEIDYYPPHKIYTREELEYILRETLPRKLLRQIYQEIGMYIA